MIVEVSIAILLYCIDCQTCRVAQTVLYITGLESFALFGFGKKRSLVLDVVQLVHARVHVWGVRLHTYILSYSVQCSYETN